MRELGIECELRVLPFPPRLRSPEYLAENQLGTIPLLVDGTTRMRESSMIGHYLATRAGSDLAVGPDEPDYGRYLDGLAYGETTLTWPQAVALLYGTFPPEADRLPRVVDDMKARLAVVFGDLDRLLEGREWFAADRFTMADVSIGYAIKLAAYIEVYDSLSKRVRSYFERLAARPAYHLADTPGEQA